MYEKCYKNWKFVYYTHTYAFPDGAGRDYRSPPATLLLYLSLILLASYQARPVYFRYFDLVFINLVEILSGYYLKNTHYSGEQF